ncbi:MAG: amidase [Burkholderiaceae bacterium]
MNLLGLGTLDLLREMKAQRLSPVELMEFTLATAEQVNADLSAFITIANQPSIEAARHFEHAYKTGAPLPVCAGIPVSVKDTEDTAGIRTTYGSPLYRDHVPAADASVASNLRRAGAIIFAKTNMPSFAHRDVGVNLLVPPARNPHKPSHHAGGSSSGAAIAVATGLSAFAHGTDGAGSVRIPASFCGVVGFKPTYGRIPLWPARDLWAARSHHGVLARTVEDAAVGMSAVTGHNDFDPLSNTEQVDWLGYRRSTGLRELKGAYIDQLGPDDPDEEVAAICRRAATRLVEAGFHLEDYRVETEDTHDWYSDLWQPIVARQLAAAANNTPELLDPTLLAAVRRGASVDIDRHLAAREKRSRFHTSFTHQVSSFDYLITPTLPCVAWPVDGEPTVAGGRPPKHAGKTTKWESVYFFNILGWPAISIPCGTTRDGLPVGIQIVAMKDQDLRCLALAAALEGLLKPQP